MRSHQSPRVKPTHAFAKFPIVLSLSFSLKLISTDNKRTVLLRAKLPRRSAFKFPAPRGKNPQFPSVTRERYSLPYIIALLAPFVNGNRQKIFVIFYTISQDIVFCRKMGNKMYYLGRFWETQKYGGRQAPALPPFFNRTDGFYVSFSDERKFFSINPLAR